MSYEQRLNMINGGGSIDLSRTWKYTCVCGKLTVSTKNGDFHCINCHYCHLSSGWYPDIRDAEKNWRKVGTIGKRQRVTEYFDILLERVDNDDEMIRLMSGLDTYTINLSEKKMKDVISDLCLVPSDEIVGG